MHAKNFNQQGGPIRLLDLQSSAYMPPIHPASDGSKNDKENE
jgi:hypothetical protein